MVFRQSLNAASKFVFASVPLDEGGERVEGSGFLEFGGFDAGVEEKQSRISIDRMAGTKLTLLRAVHWKRGGEGWKEGECRWGNVKEGGECQDRG